MEENINRKVIRISRKKFIITIIVIIVVVFLGYKGLTGFVAEDFGPAPSSGSGGGVMMESPAKLPSMELNNPLSGNSLFGDLFNESTRYDDRYYGQPTISDTREFLKTSYSSEIKTRKVPEMVKSVKNTIKGSDGRIDSYNSSEKRGYVSFVVAKSNFETLRDELESLTHEKLYTEDVSATNLLNQKQSIERQEENVTTTLEGLKTQLSALNSKHAQTVNTINQELYSIQVQLISVRASISSTTDPGIINSLRTQEVMLMNQEATQKTKLANENSSYSAQKRNLDSQISDWENNLENVKKQDTQFAENIETVNGYVNVRWVSLWQLALIFSPIHPTIVIIVIIILLWIFLARKRMPRLMFE